MISNKEDLKRYLEEDRKALGRGGNRPANDDLIWRFEIALRKYEYYSNCKMAPIPILNPFIKRFWRSRWNSLGLKCGYSIPRNCFEEGLSIAHTGTIVVNAAAKIGKNCRIHVCTNIGTAAGTSTDCPIIGDDCYIGPGAKLFGSIRIGNGVAIGANAVVNKSFEENDVSIAGVPAKIISNKGSKSFS